MIQKRTRLAVLMVLTLSVILAACGGGTNNKVSDPIVTNNNSNSESTNTPSNETEGLSGDFEIQYFVGGYGDSWWKSMLGKFKEKHPNLNIIEQAGPLINEQMMPRWIQGNPPDLVYLDGSGFLDVGTAAKDGQLMDLTEWFATAVNDDGVPLSEAVITQPQLFGNKVYSIPLVFGSWGTFYNKSLFKQNNWEVPTDFESFLKVGEQIKAAGIAPYTHAGIYTAYFNNGFLYPTIVSANGDDPSILQDMAANVVDAYRSDAVMTALQKVVAMREKGLLDSSAVALNHTDSQILFLQDKAAFLPNGLWLENEMANDTPDDFEFGYIPSIGQAPGGKYISNPYTSPVAIAQEAKNPDAAKAFIQFIYTERNAIEWAESTGALMNLKVDLEQSEASQVSKGAINFYNSPNLVLLPAVSFHPDVDKELQNATLSLIDGKITPEEWVKRLISVVEKVS
ncbi:ABC transporter substrate-binding protein [Paenibacillus sp. MY03]|uniref:extracellular solute-binding protein n=1 Tax=Paenibacillus sp. MY03 TaxID=302980 RepID=UPI000B3C3F5F|nr:extracellular solute-binding protein [Paenibacillus sp. MY03]OUS78763.1 ABC transporter substrate-binding protein [Paenibacillus sp. MY03]